MTSLVTSRFDVPLVEGQGYSLSFVWSQSFGFSFWSINRTYALNDVVKSWPDPDPSSSLYFLAGNAGVSGNLPPTWPADPGGTVIDNPGAQQILWTAQTDASIPVDLSAPGTTAVWAFKSEPDAPGAPLVIVTEVSGIVLGGANGAITVSLTPDQVACLLAVTEHGSQALRINLGGSQPATVWIGDFDIQRSPAGS